MTKSRETSTNATDEATVARQLVTRIQAGESAAETELVERYSPGLLYLLRRWTRDTSVAEDIHQEAFRLAIEKIRGGQPRDASKLQGFLRGLARNLSTRFYQRKERWRDSGQADEQMPDLQQGQLARLLRQEKSRLIHQLLDELPRRRDRQILLRFYIAEEPRERIRADLGLSDLHLNRVLFRARRRFRELCEAKELRR